MKFLVFSLFSEIWEHSIPESLITKQAFLEGHEVEYLLCGGMLENLCTSMEARLVEYNSSKVFKMRVCESCQSRAKRFAKKAKSSFYLNNYRPIDINKKIKIFFKENIHVDPTDVSIGGINIGRMAFYETALKYKKTDVTLEKKDENIYFNFHLENTLRVYFSLELFLKENPYQNVIIYSPQYAINHVAATILEKKGASIYFIEAGVNISNRLDTLRVWNWKEFKLVNPLLKHWNEVSQYDVFPFEVNNVTKHFLSLLQAKSHMVYSAQLKEHRKIREYFKIPNDKKILLATMSSYDEAYSAYLAGLFPKEKVCSDVFTSQIEWIRYLIDYVTFRNDVFLIIRVHPRDFPNKREKVQSYQARMLLESFKQTNNNYIVNWPTENVSLYEMFDEIDVLLTGWSVTAVEAASLGIPVVTYDSNMPSYPSNIMFSGRTKETYAKNIDRALNKGWTFDQVIASYHWLSVNHNLLSLPISKNFTQLINLFCRLPFRVLFKFFWFFQIDLKLIILLSLVKRNKNGVRSIVQVLKGEKPSGDLSCYVTSRKQMAKREFERVVKVEFSNLLKHYYKDYKKNVEYETLYKKVCGYINE